MKISSWLNVTTILNGWGWMQNTDGFINIQHDSEWTAPFDVLIAQTSCVSLWNLKANSLRIGTTNIQTMYQRLWMYLCIATKKRILLMVSWNFSHHKIMDCMKSCSNIFARIFDVFLRKIFGFHGNTHTTHNTLITLFQSLSSLTMFHCPELSL